MECLQAGKLLAVYRRGNIDKEHLFVLKGHLRKCPACRKDFFNARIRKYSFRAGIVFIVAAALLFLIVHGTYREDIDLESVKHQIVSNVIIEVFSDDKLSDANKVKVLAEDFGLKVLDEDPVSVRLEKYRVDGFINGLSGFIEFPEDTNARVGNFVDPLGEKDEVVIKIKFLEKT